MHEHTRERLARLLAERPDDPTLQKIARVLARETGADNRDLNSVRGIAYLVQNYEAEVYNGGHMQFFLNSTGEYAEPTLEALLLLGAIEHAGVLAEALALVRDNPLPEEHGSEIYRTSPLAGPLHAIDRAYWQVKPELANLLQAYYEQHRESFI